MNKEQKTAEVQLKDAGDEGSFEAVIATLGVIDKDGDIVEKGALEGLVAPIVPSHDSSSVPLGKVTISERGDQVVAAGKFNLNVSAAKDWHEAIKFDLSTPPSRHEWSWGFYVTESRKDKVGGKSIRRIDKVDLLEVSPVLRGASVGTRTLVAKRAQAAAEAEALVEEDGEAVELILDNDPAVTYSVESEPAEEPKAEAGVRLVDQVRAVTRDAKAAIDRLNEAAMMRAERGRELAEETRAEAIDMATAVEEMRQVAKSLADLVTGCASGDEVANAVSKWAENRARWGRS
jgi:hypothetical protein